METKVNKLLRGPWVAVAIVVGLLLLKVFTGIPFWWMLAIVVFFTTVQIIFTGGEITPGSKVLGIIMAVIFLIALGDSAWEANFPRSYAKKEVLKSRIDQSASGVMGDQTRVDAEDIWEFQKTKQGQKFLDYYDRLLDRGKTKEAADTLIGFSKAWDLDEKLEKSSSEDEEPTQPVITLPVPVNSSESMTLHKGESWCPNHVFKKGDKVIYKIEYAPIKHRASEGPRIINPGQYEGKVSESGLLAFDGFEKLSKITVYY